jgi:hypothetical protein
MKKLMGKIALCETKILLIFFFSSFPFIFTQFFKNFLYFNFLKSSKMHARRKFQQKLFKVTASEKLVFIYKSKALTELPAASGF